MKILCVSVHPDDETLGCGGTLLKHRAEGDEIDWAIVTVGHEPQWSREVLARKAEEVRRVAEAYGISRVFKLDLPTVRLDAIPQTDIITRLHDVVKSARPHTVYTVHSGDIHTDHHAAFTAIAAVLKPFHMSALGVRRFLSFETLSSTDAAPVVGYAPFLPTVFHDVTPYMDRKVEIMKLFASEQQSELLPRGETAMRALARYRGASVGVKYAEAFMLVREFNR